MAMLRRIQAALGRVAVFAALLAVAVRLLAGVAPLPPGEVLAAFGGSAICHAPGSTTPADEGEGNAAHDCALCPACLSVLPPPMAGPVATGPARAIFAVRYAMPAPGAGPPAAEFTIARPRGPPGLV
ncbi:MAG: hypothetical protein NT133_14830 [Alphaproteobacteria bacterium]|nr:hypothetical protein [Alphaproteobacteria bacterium]